RAARRPRRVHPDDLVGRRQPLAVRRVRWPELDMDEGQVAPLRSAEPRGEGGGRAVPRHGLGGGQLGASPERQGADPLHPPWVERAALGQGAGEDLRVSARGGAVQKSAREEALTIVVVDVDEALPWRSELHATALPDSSLAAVSGTPSR